MENEMMASKYGIEIDIEQKSIEDKASPSR